MRVYIGQTRSRVLIAELEGFGFGEMVVRGELPPRRNPFAYDNGAFRDFTAGKAFDFNRWARDLRFMNYRDMRPDFVVVPDKVAAGAESLRVSLDWVDWIPTELGPRYLVVQDGMSEADVAAVIGHFEGIFVGGSTEWKLETAGAWARLAHRNDRPIHIGRVGTPDRARWAKRIGADSIDSTQPLWSAGHLSRFAAAVEAMA